MSWTNIAKHSKSGFLEEGMASNIPFLNPPATAGDEINVVAAFKISSTLDIRKCIIEQWKINSDSIDWKIKDRNGNVIFDSINSVGLNHIKSVVGAYTNGHIRDGEVFVTYIARTDGLATFQATYTYNAQIVPFCIHSGTAQVNSIIIDGESVLQGSGQMVGYPKSAFHESGEPNLFPGLPVESYPEFGNTLLLLTDDVELHEGYNSMLETDILEPSFTYHAIPGEGLGFGPPCNSEPITDVLTINNQRPDDAGNINLSGNGCYRFWLDGAYNNLSNTFIVDDHELNVFNFCEECCSCEKYEYVYKVLKKINVKLVGTSGDGGLAKKISELRLGNESHSGLLALVTQFNNAIACRLPNQVLISDCRLWPLTGWNMAYQVIIRNNTQASFEGGPFTFSFNFGTLQVKHIGRYSYQFSDPYNPIRIEPSNIPTDFDIEYITEDVCIPITRYIMVSGVIHISDPNRDVIAENQIPQTLTVRMYNNLLQQVTNTTCEFVIDVPLLTTGGCAAPIPVNHSILSNNTVLVVFNRGVEWFGSMAGIGSYFEMNDGRNVTGITTSGNELTITFDGPLPMPDQAIGINYVKPDNAPWLVEGTQCDLQGSLLPVESFSIGVVYG